MRQRRTRSLFLLATTVAVTTLLGTAVAVSGVAAAATVAPRTWNATLADAPGAAALTGGGAGVTVAVLDTWIDQTHPEFSGRVLAGADCSDATGACRTLSGSSAAEDGCEPHGTHVAGIVASKDYGVAPAAKILPVRVLADSDGQCVATPAAVANGIDYAVGAGAKVINVSLGGDSSTAAIVADQPIVDAANTAAKAGDLVVFAAGNSGQGAAAGSFGTAIVVGAVGPTGSLASYSNTGATLLAPGGDTASSGADCSGDPHASTDCIESTWFCAPAQAGCDPHGLAYDEGTSMAAPMVSGTAALLFAQHPSRGLSDVVSTLETTAHPVPGSTDGLIDVCGAVRRAAPAGTVCGRVTAATTRAAARSMSCPKTITVKRGTKPVIRCKILPKHAGVVIAVEYLKGKTWVTKFKVRTARDGSFRAVGYSAKSGVKVRLAIGKLTAITNVKIKKA